MIKKITVVLKKSLKRRNDSATKYEILVIQLEYNELDEYVFMRQFYYSTSRSNFIMTSVYLDDIHGYYIGLPFRGNYTFVSSN